MSLNKTLHFLYSICVGAKFRQKKKKFLQAFLHLSSVKFSLNLQLFSSSTREINLE